MSELKVGSRVTFTLQGNQLSGVLEALNRLALVKIDDEVLLEIPASQLTLVYEPKYPIGKTVFMLVPVSVTSAPQEPTSNKYRVNVPAAGASLLSFELKCLSDFSEIAVNGDRLRSKEEVSK